MHNCRVAAGVPCDAIIIMAVFQGLCLWLMSGVSAGRLERGNFLDWRRKRHKCSVPGGLLLSFDRRISLRHYCNAMNICVCETEPRRGSRTAEEIRRCLRIGCHGSGESGRGLPHSPTLARLTNRLLAHNVLPGLARFARFARFTVEGKGRIARMENCCGSQKPGSPSITI